MSKTEKKLTIAFCTTVFGFFIVMLDATITNIALNHIGQSLNATNAQLQWVVDAYTLVLAALLLLAGVLCDKMGASFIYKVGLALFGIFSLACALAPNTIILIILRAFQGIGGACIIPSSLAVITQIHPDQHQRSKAIGLWGAAGGAAAALGPILGGILVSAIGWQAVFAVNIPIIALILLLSIKFIPGKKQGSDKSLDLVGQIFIFGFLFLLCYLFISSSEEGSGTIKIILAICCFLLGLGFLVREKMALEPMIRLSLFVHPGFSVATVIGFILNFSFFGQLYVLALFFQREVGWDAWLAGLAMVPQASSALLASPLGGKAVARYGARITMLVGLVIGAVGFAGLWWSSTDTPYWVIAVVSFLGGFGMAFAMPAATATAVGAVDSHEQGLASGVVNTARQTGTVVGVAVLGGFVADGVFMDGFRAAMFGASGAFCVGALLTGWALCSSQRK